VPSSRPAVSIRRHLQATSLLAVLAGYVVLLLVNRQLSSRLRHDRHMAQVQATTAALQQLLPQEVNATTKLQRQMADVSSPSLLVWLAPEARGAAPRLLPIGATFRDYTQGKALIHAADAVQAPGGVPRDWQFQGRAYITSAFPISLAGRSYQLRFLQDYTLEVEQERVLTLLLVAVAGGAALFTSALLRLVIHRGLLPLDLLSASLAGMSSSSLNTERLSLRGQPIELHSIAHAFNDLLDRLAEAWDHQRTFVNGVSHELRTPITLISGYSRRLLRRTDGLNAHEAEQLQLVASEAESMGRLVNDLLEIARDDTGQLQLACRPIDPYPVLQALVSRLDPAIGGRLQLLPAADGCGEVLADPERLSQCLTNLIENALKYSPPGSAIQLAFNSEGDQVVFHIRDQGPGVPLADREQIFERFKRGSTSGSTSGHGIGLAVVKALMDRMGGRVLVADAPGGGADFQLWFPAVPSSPMEPRRLHRWFRPD
jgi:hypothetical protein